MAMNLHKGDNVNRLHSKVINTIPYIFKHELLTIKTIKVMIVRKLEEVKNALLHDAILIAIKQGYKFNRVYSYLRNSLGVRYLQLIELIEPIL